MRFWPEAAAWLSGHSPEMRLALRVTIAAGASFALARGLQAPQGIWAVITAVIVMQASVGGSLKAAMDRFAGTLAGAAVGALVSVALPHQSFATLLAAILAAVAPLAFLAAVKPSFRVAPVTALIMLLPTSAALGEPWRAAVDRVLEIGLGNLVGLVVALAVLPARAHALVAERASAICDLNADLLGQILSATLSGEGRPGVPAIHARIRAALKQLEAAAEEAARERRSHLTDQPDPEPLVRALYRLRHDLVMVGRAAATDLPPDIAASMAPALGDVRDAAQARLRELGAAFAARRNPEPSDALDAAIRRYASGIEEVRRAGALRDQPGAVIGRFWSLSFAFEQLQHDLADVETLAARWVAARRTGGDQAPDPSD